MNPPLLARLDPLIRATIRLVIRLQSGSREGSIVVLQAENSILLLRQRYRYGWTMPGGFLDAGEHPDAAARRETLEEVGIRLQEVGPAVSVTCDDHVDHIYVVARRAADPITIESWEIAEARWWSLDALPVLQPEADAALHHPEVRARMRVYPVYRVA